MENSKISLLYPFGEDNFNKISDVTFHDLGIDFICQKVTEKQEEQVLLEQIFKKMSDNPKITDYRCAVFQDIYNNPEMCTKLIEELEKINYEKQFSGFGGHFEDSDSAWELLHRLEEINTYIKSVEAIYKNLSETQLKSEGLKKLKEYVNHIYTDNGFSELKTDIQNLKTTTSDLKSITVGINLNEKYEAHGIGLISFNKKSFTNSSALGNFVSKVSAKDSISDTTEWNENYKYHPITVRPELLEKLSSIANINDPAAENSTYYMDRIANTLIGNIVHKLKMVLKKYVFLPITDITDLIPEFIFYIRFAAYIKKMEDKGFKFCKAEISSANRPENYMNAKGIYNFKLLSAFCDTQGPSEIVPNDLVFDSDHLVYILTGANRGGKTTITQAIGLLFVLAQAGIFVPGESFEFSPVDSIYTHFPADEDKTMDLGRLGEECKRFKELYSNCTKTSLLLLNETYSTTSFEEGYYIAKDSVKAILTKGIRTIYNTHMHKLAFDIEEINAAIKNNKAASLVVKTQPDGKRSFKVELAPPEGNSFAKDIAQKYGVTFEMLTEN